MTSDESCKTLLQLFEKTYLCNNNNGEVVNNEAFKMADESHYRHQSIKKLANDYVFKITFVGAFLIFLFVQCFRCYYLAYISYISSYYCYNVHC